MKKVLFVLVVVAMLTMMLGTTAFAVDAFVVEKGFNDDGYNYQAHLYVGDNGNVDDHLVMKWNDAWLSNKDRGTQLPNGGLFTDLSTPDGDLDRHYGYDTYFDSGAWCTNHWSGTYVDDVTGKTQHWTATYKIIALKSTDVLVGGYWFTANGKEIGELIWGQFAITLYVYNDTGTGDHGVFYKGQPGLGNLQ